MGGSSTTTTRHIAFLRAINVGGHTVTMDRLRRLFEALGFANVETFIASGNVIFDAPAPATRALEEQIEGHLQQSLGYAVATFLRSPAELADVATRPPFPAAEIDAAASLYVGFLAAPPTDAAREKLIALSTPTDEFRVQGREFYWLCRTKMSESTITGALLERALGMPATMRNATTVRKLAAKYPAC